MKISDLNKITVEDLQKINYKKQLEDVKKKPETAISAVIIVIALLFSFYIYNSQQGELKRLKNQVAIMETKQVSIDRLLAAKEKIKNFWNSIPAPLAEEQVLNMMTDIATNRQVRIESLAPSRRNSGIFYDSSAINLLVSASSYENLWLFAYDLEKSNHGMRVDSLEMQLENQDQRSRNSETGDKIIAQISLTAINFKPADGYQSEKTAQ